MFTVDVAPSKDAKLINSMLNHPEVRPWIADAAEGVLDVTAQINSPVNTFLMGEFGGVMLVKVLAGTYECHTFALPEGRGVWALGLVMAAQRWMFTKTDCVEILTRIPETHRPALGLAIKAGMTKEFTRHDGVKINDKLLSVDVYKVTLSDWAKRSADAEATGAVFHAWLNEQAEKAGFRNPHEDDPNLNRYAGACLEMIKGGQALKGVMFYNRWAWISRHATIKLSSVSPIVVDMDIGQVRLIGDELELIPGAGAQCAKAVAA
jgi:hypothetical protein